MDYSLKSLGYFISATGGAPSPFTVPEDKILFELITHGEVYDPIDQKLHQPGWVFVHFGGESTVYKSPPNHHYECMTVLFHCDKPGEDFYLSKFLWQDARNRNTFCHEMLHSFHHAEIDRDILGNTIWSQLRYRQTLYQKERSPDHLPPRLKQVLGHIEKYFGSNLSIQELADLVEISPSHLHAEFKRVLNSTPHQYLIEQRMREARHRLVTTNDPIKAIADQVGYSNTENFCRVFKQHFQRTAADYRKIFSIQSIPT